MVRRPADGPNSTDDAPSTGPVAGSGAPGSPGREGEDGSASEAASPEPDASQPEGRRLEKAGPETSAASGRTQEAPEAGSEGRTSATAGPARAETAPGALRDRRIGIIGAGAMGGALCRGLVHANAAPANRILVSDPHAGHVQALQQSLGIRVAESNIQVAKYTDIIVLAVKPYMVASVLDEISDALRRDPGKPAPLLISIAAGVHISKLEARLKEPIPVVRAMPNTPAQVGLGACAFCRGTHAEDGHLAHAAEIFRSVGIAVEVQESLMDAVTALSGSGPAYVYLMIEALVDGGVKVGLPRDIAMQLATQTVLGAAKMVIETGMHPAQLRDMVTTPAGTTIAAIAGLEHSGVRAALIDAVERAAARSRELG